MTARRPLLAVRHLLVFLFFVALSIAFTWPVAIRLDTAVSDPGDPLLNAWILDSVCRSLEHNPLTMFQAPIFFPAKFPLAYSENMIGIAIPMLPFHLAGLDPMTLYNVAMIIGFAFSAFGAYILGRTLTGSTPASIIAGALYAFTQFRIDHLAHLQIIWSGWLPLILACVIPLWREVTPRRVAALTICLVMNALSNVHWFLFGTTAAALTFLFFGFALRQKTKREWLQIALAFVVAGIVLLPVLYPYQVVAKLYDFKRSPGEARGGSGELLDWIRATDRSAVWGRVLGQGAAERSLFPNLLPLVFLVVAVARRTAGGPPAGRPPGRRRALDIFILLFGIASLVGALANDFELAFRGHRIISIDGPHVPLALLAIALYVRFHRAIGAFIARSAIPIEVWLCLGWVVIGFLAAFGMKGFFHHFLYRVVPPFRSVRAPVRWAIVAYTGLAGTSAYGLAALAKRWRFAYPIAALAAFFDVAPAIAWQHAPADMPRVYSAIKSGPLMEIPIRADYEYIYLLFAARHHLLSMNGISGFEPPIHRRIRNEWLATPVSEATLPDLANAGCRLLLVHDDWLEDHAAATHAWIAREVSAGRLGYLGRFDHGIGGDWLFVVGDRGKPLDDNYARFIAGKPTANESAFGAMESAEIVDGALQVRGWALSPNSIRRVDVLLDSGRTRVPARFEPRPDIDALHPSYPRAQPSGFALKIDRRPANVPSATDVQVEIIDGMNRRTRLRDVYLRWN